MKEKKDAELYSFECKLLIAIILFICVISWIVSERYAKKLEEMEQTIAYYEEEISGYENEIYDLKKEIDFLYQELEEYEP